MPPAETQVPAAAFVWDVIYMPREAAGGGGQDFGHFGALFFKKSYRGSENTRGIAALAGASPRRSRVERVKRFGIRDEGVNLQGGQGVGTPFIAGSARGRRKVGFAGINQTPIQS